MNQTLESNTLKKIWEHLIIGLKKNTALHLLVDFYKKIDDIQAIVCHQILGSKYRSFATRKEKLEKKLGKYISGNVDHVLNLRRKLVHDGEESAAAENLFVEQGLEKLLSEIPIKFKKWLLKNPQKQTEGICWYFLFEFTSSLTDQLIGLIEKGLLRADSSPEKIKEQNAAGKDIVWKTRIKLMKYMRVIERQSDRHEKGKSLSFSGLLGAQNKKTKLETFPKVPN